MSGEPLVSVLMNCYNGEKYLCDAIESVLAQTYQNWEVIFWDNQSTDRSAEIFHSYADSRLKYYYAPTHTWLYEARNRAIEKSRGEYVAFLDVDDQWLPQKLEEQMVLFADPEVGVVCGDWWIESERRGTRWRSHRRPVPTGWVLDALLENYYVGLLTLVVRRSALELLDYQCDARYHVIGDFDLVARLAVRWKLDYVRDPVAVYRLHDGNETAKHASRLVDELELWWSEMSAVDAIRLSSGARFIPGKIAYLRAICTAVNGDRKAAYSLLSAIPSRNQRFKVWCVLLLPKVILRRSRSQLI